MRTDCDTLDYALSLFRDDDRGAYLSGFAQAIGPQVAMSPQADPRWAQTVNSNMHWITQDLWNVTTILDRLAWMRMRAVLGDADLSERWRYYAAVDIQSFHVEIRSMLDYAARIVAASCPKPGQVPDSFRKLLEWITDNPRRIPRELLELVAGQKVWFGEIRAVRDLLLHQGGHAIIFSTPQDGILFQVFDVHLRKSVVTTPGLLYNENVVHFDRYAALHLARLLACIEDLGVLLQARASGEAPKVMNHGPYDTPSDMDETAAGAPR